MARPRKSPEPLRLLLTLFAVLVVVALAGRLGGDPLGWLEGDSAPPPAAATLTTDALSAEERRIAKGQLAELAVAPPGAMRGYGRDAFPHWRDPDRNGCDAREDALLAAGQKTVTAAGCRVVSGVWRDPYGGQRMTEPRALDIDHIVPLANAWRSGAASWTQAKRTRFANDPRNLLAVEASLNRQKGDKGPEAWLPPRNSYRARYAALWIEVKHTYGLTVSTAERDTLTRLLE